MSILNKLSQKNAQVEALELAFNYYKFCELLNHIIAGDIEHFQSLNQIKTFAYVCKLSAVADTPTLVLCLTINNNYNVFIKLPPNIIEIMNSTPNDMSLGDIYDIV